MIRVTIDLNSAVTGRKKQLRMIDITNDGTGDAFRGNYDVQVYDETNLFRGRIENYDRKRNILDLVSRAIDAVWDRP